MQMSMTGLFYAQKDPMTPLLEIGEMRISVPDHDYFLRPSFSAMASLGEPSEIVRIYASIHGSDVTKTIERLTQAFRSIPSHFQSQLYRCNDVVISDAMRVIQACCAEDLTQLIGEWKGWKTCVVYRPGLMNKFEIILIAQELMAHGVIGRAKVRQLQRHEGTSRYTNEFSAIDYINSARSHFNMTRSEAEQLTMTEMQLLLAMKYPEEKGFTREEYDAVADDFLKRQAKRVANGS